MTPLSVLDRSCCPPLLDGVLDGEEAETLAAGFRALADPHRIRLLSLLAAAPEGEACTCDLIEPLGLAQPTVSHHLRILLEAGLVSRDRRGRWTWYRVDRERLGLLRSALGA